MAGGRTLGDVRVSTLCRESIMNCSPAPCACCVCVCLSVRNVADYLLHPRLPIFTYCIMGPTKPKAAAAAKELRHCPRTEEMGSTWNLSSLPSSRSSASRSEIAGEGSQLVAEAGVGPFVLPSATQMVTEGKRLQEEAFSARTYPGQEAGISQPAAATHQFSTQSDDGWVEASSSTTGAGTNGMLDGATPNAGRVAVGTMEECSAPNRECARTGAGSAR